MQICRILGFAPDLKGEYNNIREVLTGLLAFVIFRPIYDMQHNLFLAVCVFYVYLPAYCTILANCTYFDFEIFLQQITTNKNYS